MRRKLGDEILGDELVVEQMHAAMHDAMSDAADGGCAEDAGEEVVENALHTFLEILPATTGVSSGSLGIRAWISSVRARRSNAASTCPLNKRLGGEAEENTANLMLEDPPLMVRISGSASATKVSGGALLMLPVMGWS